MKTMLALAAFALAATVQAAPPPGYDVEAAFNEADTNKDGSVEMDEFYNRLVEIYFHADTDKNGTLSKEEFTRAVVIEENFAAADTNGDGILTRQEFIHSRLPLFEANDTNKDGALSLDEVKAALEKGNAK